MPSWSASQFLPVCRALPVLLPLIAIAGPARAQSFGCDPSPADAFASHGRVRITARAIADRPKSFSLAEFLPPVGDQGATSACVGWSTAYYCYTASIAQQRKLTDEQRQDLRFRFSPSFIWHQHNDGNAEKGMHIYQAFDILAKQGCASLADMPWKEDDVKSQPDDSAKTHAIKYKARETVSLFKGKLNGEPGDPEKLKVWLAEAKRPFVIGIPVYPDFMKASHEPDFVYKPSDSAAKRLGFHAICIVGYDDAKHAFLMVNSWTTAWGAKGFLWLNEDFVANEAIEGWGMRPGGPIPKAVVRTNPGDPSAPAGVAVTPNIVYEAVP